jgi:DNA-binding NarL/FixJ family response regulator
MINVLLADDHKIMSAGIKLILEGDKEIKVVGYAANIDEAINLCMELSPDVILMDIAMSTHDGELGAKLIKNNFSSIKVIILTGCTDAENIILAMKCGANGYMLKNINPEELIMTVKTVALGLNVMHKDAFYSVSEHVHMNERGPVLNKSNSNVNIITEREISIIRHIIEGKENREIAKTLYMSEGTIKNIISGIFKKLDLRDRIQLVVFAIKNDLV